MQKYLVLLLMACCGSAIAVTETNKTIDRLGVQGGNAYFDVKESLTLTCAWGNIYLDITTDFGKAAYSNLLAAKSSGRILSRIDYSQTTAGGQCNLDLVEVKD